MRSTRHLSFLVLLGGPLGIVVCLAGIAAAWTVGCWFRHTNDIVFERIDTSLASICERIHVAQGRAQESRITAQDIGQSVKEWTSQEISQRLSSRLNLDEKARQMGVGLEQADHYLELTEATVESVRQAMEFGRSVGAPVDATLVDPVHEQLEVLRSLLRQAKETATGIQGIAADINAGTLPAERLNQIAQMALRGVVTLGEIDVRLGRAADSVSEMQTSAKQLQSKTHSWIIAGTLGAILLIAWLAAGQVSLCAYGWKSCQRGRLPSQQ